MEKSRRFINLLILGTFLMFVLGTSTKVMANNLDMSSSDRTVRVSKNITYTIQSGDTVWAVGMRYNINPKVIEEMNLMNDPYKMQSGMVLRSHTYYHGERAEVTLKNNQGITVKENLEPEDKLNKNKSFGQNVTSEELTKSEKKNMRKDLVKIRKLNKNQEQSEMQRVSYISSSHNISN